MLVSRSKRLSRNLARNSVAAGVLLALVSPALLAEEAGTLEEVIVTAQKRTENLQDVPISIDTLSSQKLTELHVQNFQDYVRILPSVASTPGLGSGAGFAAVYMRGIVTGGDGQATTSQPSVGMYLDEQPITTIQGNLDVHMYDIARVEALAGPQGTLYGASSQAGTIRIITNKPDLTKFSAGYSLEGNIVDGSDTGYVLEGFMNLPVSDKAAVRLVGWTLHDAGWIDNVAATRTYTGRNDTRPTIVNSAGATVANPDYCVPTCALDDVTINNFKYAKKNYNTLDTTGARAALRVNLNDNWTVTPVAQTQTQKGKGFWGDDLNNVGAPGKYAVAHFRDEFTNDKWYQTGLTIEGKVANFDLTYSGNYLNRDVDGSFDYSDYSYWYDQAYTNGYFAGLFLDNAGKRVNPAQSFINNDHYTKQSHEFRISSPRENRLRGMLGFFLQKQYHDFQQSFGNLPGLADAMLLNQDEPNGRQYPGVVYLNSVDRIDRDKAVFGQLSYDITKTLELTVGARYFKPEVTVKGFFGFGLGFNPNTAPTGTEPGAVANGGSGAFSPLGMGWSSNGEWRCPSQAAYKKAPCQNVDKGISESDHIGRVNLSWKATDDAMIYGTWSQGYRPGGINRNPFAGNFKSDFLTNWELGWKSEWLSHRLQFNGALFLEKWDRFQVSFQGGNGITQVANGPSADIRGTEMQLDWLPTSKLRLSVSAAYYKSELKNAYGDYDSAGNITKVKAPKGTVLPITPKFKGNLIARYSFNVGTFDAHLQGALAYSGKSTSSLDVADNAITGDVPANTTLDISAGVHRSNYTLELFVKNVTNEDAPLYKTSECTTAVCGVQTYGVRPQPTTIGLKFEQSF